MIKFYELTCNHKVKIRDSISFLDVIDHNTFFFPILQDLDCWAQHCFNVSLNLRLYIELINEFSMIAWTDNRSLFEESNICDQSFITNLEVKSRLWKSTLHLESGSHSGAFFRKWYLREFHSIPQILNQFNGKFSMHIFICSRL
jgi:hypothetical protein